MSTMFNIFARNARASNITTVADATTAHGQMCSKAVTLGSFAVLASKKAHCIKFIAKQSIFVQ